MAETNIQRTDKKIQWLEYPPGFLATTYRKIRNKITKAFGSFAAKEQIIYAEIVEQGVGFAPEATGWDLSEDADEYVEAALKQLGQEIALARAPYGNTVIVATLIPLAEDRRSTAPGQDYGRLPPFRKEDWPRLKQQAAEQMKAVAEKSPVKCVATHIFNYGDVMLKAMNENDWVYRKSI